jgi:hypothetical protein
MKPRLITKKQMELTLTLKMKKSASHPKTMKSSRGAHRRDRGLRIEYTRELLTPKRRKFETIKRERDHY